MLDSASPKHEHSHSQNRFSVIPTPAKLNAASGYTGRGVRIAFLDSGFYPHPDFARRVVAFHDIAGEESAFEQIATTVSHHWHGTQTVTVCAGDGSLSAGVYRGLACESDLVLVKVSRKGHIGDSEIEAGLEWVIANREKYNIRILNVSLGGDCDVPTAESRINLLVEEITASGVVVCAAAGNSSQMRPLPPASAQSAITVGGYSDENTFSAEEFDLYHSGFGATADGLIKPELISPAMYVAAPIIPGTANYRTAETLSMLADMPDYAFRSRLEGLREAAELGREILDLDHTAARHLIDDALRRHKIVSTHYQHVDGTSFAAPITASVIAQMLEARPSLTPNAVKNILLSSATRLSGRPALRQGFGMLNAQLAVEMAFKETHRLESATHHPPRIVDSTIIFTYHNDQAATVELVGDFNEWDSSTTPLDRGSDGIWRAAIPCRPIGTYRYKYLINGSRWTEDPSHLLKEDDGFGGFNSILVIANH